MSAVAKTSDLREAHKDLTRTRILEAAIGLLQEGELEAITVAGVAARAGVTERTIYRHFVSREELLAAIWPRLQSLTGSPGFPTTALAAATQPTRLFPGFDRHPGA